MKNKKLGCIYCSEVDSLQLKDVHVSKEWRSYNTERHGKSKAVMQTSLRKKMNERFSSKSHNPSLTCLKERGDNKIVKTVDRLNEKYMCSTCRIFNTVYSIAK